MKRKNKIESTVNNLDTDGVAHKLKPRSFHKSTYLQVYSVDFYPGMNHT